MFRKHRHMTYYMHVPHVFLISKSMKMRGDGKGGGGHSRVEKVGLVCMNALPAPPTQSTDIQCLGNISSSELKVSGTQKVTLLELNARHALLHLFNFSDHPNTVPRHSKPFEFYCRRYEMAAAWFKLKQGAIKVLISTQPFKCRNKTNQIQTDSTKGFGL